MLNLNLLGFIGNKIPLAEAVDAVVDFLKVNFRPVFRQISSILDFGLENLEDFLEFIPPLILILILAALSFYFVGKRSGLFTLIGLLLINNLELWSATMTTLSMVLTATIVSIIFGVPLGILAAKSKIANKIIMPILDFMQTMPAFVYLIPAVSFFGLGKVPGVIATVIFSIPPAIRFTTLGIKQVPTELIEAADSFGSTGTQKLVKVQIPLAKETIMAGINQTIMLSLSMVVIAAMIAAGGLGREVWNGIQRLQVGTAFEAGLAVVILAMILDKLTQNIAKNK
ncbi:proline/glycine betaine ABC transporter permease [Serpentinicella sp. ANB-PHB4]|uniref:ABC transporter permease n=1 Tax=Serpentinicella sp. ANB-PHB4 TaxID=3074076 RepID=UPI00285F0B70|nr:proline/glycine betaine ABC transporter permease [Serpentinicella sp. ANB-PHB4]MDR5659042.1 proline/glycine betaine ABC transporter permease [Serpentinicella sp. ANB-PHB4]